MAQIMISYRVRETGQPYQGGDGFVARLEVRKLSARSAVAF